MPMRYKKTPIRAIYPAKVQKIPKTYKFLYNKKQKLTIIRFIE